MKEGNVVTTEYGFEEKASSGDVRSHVRVRWREMSRDGNRRWLAKLLGLKFSEEED